MVRFKSKLNFTLWRLSKSKVAISPRRGLLAPGPLLQRAGGLNPDFGGTATPTPVHIQYMLVFDISGNQVLVDAWLTFLALPSPPSLQHIFSGCS